MEICIFGKTPKLNSYKAVSQFTKKRNILKGYLVHDTIQRLGCVVGCLNVKLGGKLVEILTFKIVVHLNKIAHRKKWTSRAGPCPKTLSLKSV